MENLPAIRQGSEAVPFRPEIEQSLRDGYSMYAFSSGGGLRVITINDAEGKLVGYGEASQVEEALEHAALDYSLGHETYAKQYSGENARHLHYLTGTTELSSPLDAHLRWGSTFKAHKDTDSDQIIVSLEGMKLPPDIPEGLQDRVTTSLQAETFEERGVTYKAEPCRFPSGTWGMSIEVLANPNNVKTLSYDYTQTGMGSTFAEAVAAAFEAPVTEVM